MTRSRLPVLMLAAAALVAVAVIVHDAVQPVEREWGTRAALVSIAQYRRVVSPTLKGKIVCRFEPTCSLYGQESVRRHGLRRGGWKALKRIARCTSSTPAGTVDLP